MNRRTFIRNTSLALATTPFGSLPLGALQSDEVFHLTILHTNDVHSRIDPFPMDGSRNEGQGGIARRKVLINQIRSEGQECLLLDAGDIFQGTPYFNLFGGELEMKLMSELGYDAATMGNHDFDAGIDGFDKQLVHADFPFVISNYQMNDTILSGKTSDFKIWDYGDIKVGLFGLGIELKGLVPQSLYGNTQYLDPIEIAHTYESLLKNEHQCDYVICLSHLGYQYRGSKVSDVVIAQESNHIDLIIGGHTHTFMDEPHVEKNLQGRPVIVNQAGWGGILMGRIDLFFEKGSHRKAQKGTSLRVKST